MGYASGDGLSLTGRTRDRGDVPRVASGRFSRRVRRAGTPVLRTPTSGRWATSAMKRRDARPRRDLPRDDRSRHRQSRPTGRHRRSGGPRWQPDVSARAVRHRDLSILSDDPCPCGRTSSRLLKLVGRVDQGHEGQGDVRPPAGHPAAGKGCPCRLRQFVVTRTEHDDHMRCGSS